MHVEGSELVSDAGKRQTAYGGGSVHDHEHVVRLHGSVCGCRCVDGYLTSSASSEAVYSSPLVEISHCPYSKNHDTHLLEIEEDRVEAEKEPGDSGREPAESFVAESVLVDPGAQLSIALRLGVDVCWVRGRKEEREQTGSAREPSNTANSVVETEFLNKPPDHRWVDDTGNAGTACNNTHSKRLVPWEPSRGNCLC